MLFASERSYVVLTHNNINVMLSAGLLHGGTPVVNQKMIPLTIEAALEQIKILEEEKASLRGEIQNLKEARVRDAQINRELRGLLKNFLRKVKRMGKELTTLGIDPLSGLPTRQIFISSTQQAHASAVRGKRPLSVLFIDLDNFKFVNDTYGHEAGDRVIKRFGQILLHAVRQSDLVGRYGGEEFVVVLNDTGYTEAVLFAERLCERIREELHVLATSTDRICVTASIGVAEMQQGADLAKIFARADRAMYIVKAFGRNGVAG